MYIFECIIIYIYIYIYICANFTLSETKHRLNKNNYGKFSLHSISPLEFTLNILRNIISIKKLKKKKKQQKTQKTHSLGKNAWE